MSNGHLDTSVRRSPADVVAPGAASAKMPPALRMLASGAVLAGPELARQLGISRAAVWKQIDALRRQGLEIESDAQGYRLTHPLDLLGVERVRRGIPAALRRRVGEIENHWRLDSTSSEVARRAAGLPDLSFVFADWQDAGRGRRGRQWLSAPARNLQFSCLKRFAGGYAALSGLSLAVGVAAAAALEDCGSGAVALKWPNDLMHGDAKLGGILVELGGEFMGPCHAVIGIGVNVDLPAAIRRSLERPCADLVGLCPGAPPSRNQLAAALVARLVDVLDAFDASGFSACAAAWAARDVLAGRRIRVHDPRGNFEGVAEGVDVRGALRVRTSAGVRAIDSGGITVRPA
jgi:BirA family biotin operon repressor/biotin-[acetyl-CoA-carboxylase] ligase